MVSIPILANNSTLSLDFNVSQNTLMELAPQEYDLKLNKYYDLALESKVIEEIV